MAYQKKQVSLQNRILKSPLTQIALIVCLGLLAVQVYGQYQNERKTAERRAAIETEHQTLLEKRLVLDSEVNALQDDFGVESEIRRHFDVAKEGEQVVIIIDEQLQDIPIRQVPDLYIPDQPSPNRPWYRFWE